MAKGRRFKYRYYKRKGRWSANIKNIVDTVQSIPSGISGNSIDLCLNPVQSDITVSQQYTVKNIELSVFADFNINTNTAVEDVEHYIMYVPQGMNLTTDYNLEHPEYIMAYYFQGNPLSDSQTPGYKLKLKSRLSRRLQTGDRIIYFYKLNNTSSNGIGNEFRISGLVRWWTKAN